MDSNRDIILEKIRNNQAWYEYGTARFRKILSENKGKMQADGTHYYDEKTDRLEQQRYYRKARKHPASGPMLFALYHDLVQKTHKNRLPYHVSKNQYLYTWVDLHPDGSVRNIYSGEARDPLAIIQEDHQIGKKRGDHYHSLLQESEISAHQIRAVDTFFKYNTEHIVPQSWFHAADPMKGDLHHLFVCYPSCNAKRSNLPYGDFDFYHPESADEPVRNHCGIAAEDKFEPESGKGTIARAFAYFLLHYPKAVSKSKLNRVNLSLLVQWHEVFPAGLYERHRNQAICRIQGNRNPFIDDAGLMKQLEGCLVKI
ncbi:endonuclease I family protein [Heyndrickxia coagulans]|uniref:endonuclease I family protein n=1 Tax=Heyndrickxia coagulans TaxID=1398 RepID=UPI002E1D1F52|nr:endonuclease [Heyndrickxia coagulans]MED4965261.1 endonuclease [Heyndrickxia coagulans]